MAWGLLLAGLLLLSSCTNSQGATPLPTYPSNPDPSDPSNPSKPAANKLTYANSNYPVTGGMLELNGSEGYHYQADLTLTDGSFFPITYYIYVGDIPIPYTYWLASSEKVEVYLELYATGTNFHAGTFDFINLPEDSVGRPSLEGQNFFSSGYVAIDLDNDNEVEENEEISVIGGSLSVTGTADDLTTSLNVELANGSSVVGSFEGEFLIIDE